MSRIKKSEADKAFDKLEKKRQKALDEIKRLNEPIQVFRVSDDKYLYTIREGDIKSPAQKKRERASKYNEYESTDHSQKDYDSEDQGGYKWKIAGIRPQDPEFVKLRYEERYQCDYCKFKSIYPESVISHMTFTHLPKHPGSIYHETLDDDEIAKYKEAFSHSPLRYMWYKK